ncbi:MAG: hypothetical protein ILO53_00520, partial [Clostridia bacterium]|nr:hypothetical protein [Clostridia bacterium]
VIWLVLNSNLTSSMFVRCSVFNVRRTPFFEVPDDYTTRLFSCQAFFCIFALFLKNFFTPKQSPIFRHKPPIMPDNSHLRRQNMRENASQFRNPKTHQDDSTRKRATIPQNEKGSDELTQ